MKKGCIIALVVAAVLALLVGVAVIIGAVVLGKKVGEGGLEFLAKAPNAGAVFAIETAIAEYQRQNPDANVEPTNEAWATALKDFKIGGSGDLSGFIVEGKLVDAFQQEVGVSESADGTVVITSPGKDGVLGNEDDVTSEMMTDLVEDAEASADPAPEAPAP